MRVGAVAARIGVSGLVKARANSDVLQPQAQYILLPLAGEGKHTLAAFWRRRMARAPRRSNQPSVDLHLVPN